MKFYLLVFILFCGNVLADSEAEFKIVFPKEEFVDNSFRVTINTQVSELLLQRLMSNLKFYMSLRKSVILEQAFKTQNELDSKIFFSIHTILKSIEKNESNRLFFADVKQELIEHPLTLDSQNINDRVLPNIDEFISDGT